MSVTREKKITYVTGTDHTLFLNACMLLESFGDHVHGQRLFVCDFGLDERQKAFLLSGDSLLQIPPQLLGELGHPWRCKASIVDYIPTAIADGIVWLDADMLIIGPLHEAIATTLEAMNVAGESAAVCRDCANRSLREFIDLSTDKGYDVSPFSELLRRYHVKPSQKYLNTGFLVLRSSEFAYAWRDLVLEQQDWFLFEQNCFNVLAYRPNERVRILEAAQYNVHGDMLGDALRSWPTPHEQPLVLHATSTGQHHVERRGPIGVRGYHISGQIKLFARDDLRSLQLNNLKRFIDRHLNQLIEYKLLA